MPLSPLWIFPGLAGSGIRRLGLAGETAGLAAALLVVPGGSTGFSPGSTPPPHISANRLSFIGGNFWYHFPSGRTCHWLSVCQSIRSWYPIHPTGRVTRTETVHIVRSSLKRNA